MKILNSFAQCHTTLTLLLLLPCGAQSGKDARPRYMQVVYLEFAVKHVHGSSKSLGDNTRKRVRFMGHNFGPKDFDMLGQGELYQNELTLRGNFICFFNYVLLDWIYKQ